MVKAYNTVDIIALELYYGVATVECRRDKWNDDVYM